MNHQIQASELRVIDEDGKQLGILTKREALELAEERDLDLVEISPDAKPPVAKIVDWGKYKYQKTKQQQKNRKSTKSFELKQVRMGLKISDHDLGIKLDRARKFLQAGHKVRITLVYRGREQAHKEIGFQLAQKIIDSFGNDIAVDSPPQLAGKQLNFVVRWTGKAVAATNPKQPANNERSTINEPKEQEDAKVEA